MLSGLSGMVVDGIPVEDGRVCCVVVRVKSDGEVGSRVCGVRVAGCTLPGGRPQEVNSLGGGVGEGSMSMTDIGGMNTSEGEVGEEEGGVSMAAVGGVATNM